MDLSYFTSDEAGGTSLLSGFVVLALVISIGIAWVRLSDSSRHKVRGWGRFWGGVLVVISAIWLAHDLLKLLVNLFL